MMIRYVLPALAVGLLAACSIDQKGWSTLPSGSAPSAARPSNARAKPLITESVIYSFGTHQPDGYGPASDLLEYNGVFYSGTVGNTMKAGRGGTIFSVTPSGNEIVLRILRGYQGDLGQGLAIGPKSSGGGILYGPSTFARGAAGGPANGSVFVVSLSGKLSVLHLFSGGSDGVHPNGGLTLINGTFYGTTQLGGGAHHCKLGCGTVYSITPSGTEKPIYQFAGSPDGSYPSTRLRHVNGRLYGTTELGGAYGRGTVFTVTTSGVERVVHSFGSNVHDAADPYSDLIDVGGTLYGTTDRGGQYGYGTVYSVNGAGSVKIIHSFGRGYQRGSDGAVPGRLVNINGTLYGATRLGGAHHVGTIFRITPGGSESVVYSFGSGKDGYNPNDPLYFEHTLYGTTNAGGKYGYGTVYAVGFSP